MKMFALTQKQDGYSGKSEGPNILLSLIHI